jgi:hypothetical protein
MGERLRFYLQSGTDTIVLRLEEKIIFSFEARGLNLKEVPMKRIKYPWDVALFTFFGLLGVVDVIVLMSGRIGFGYFFFGLSIVGALAMFWSAYRVPRTWPIDKRDFAIQTAKQLRRVAYVLLVLAVLSLILEFAF